MAWTIPWDLMGMQISGDFADLTIYTNRFGKKVAYPKSPPDKPPSDLQIAQRTRFKAAQSGWSGLTESVKINYENLTRRTSSPLTGQNLWIHSALTNDNQAIQTLENQTGISVPKPDFIP